MINGREYTVTVDKFNLGIINEFDPESLEKYIKPLLFYGVDIDCLKIENVLDLRKCLHALKQIEYNIKNEELKDLYGKIKFRKKLYGVQHSLLKKRGLFSITGKTTFLTRLNMFRIEYTKWMKAKGISLDIDILFDHIKKMDDYSVLVNIDYDNNFGILKLCEMYEQIVKNKKTKEEGNFNFLMKLKF